MTLFNRIVLLLTLLFSASILAQSNEGNGNPRPGFPHDTLIFHVKSAASGPVTCNDGGHSAFVRYDDLGNLGMVVQATNILITMTDWVGDWDEANQVWFDDPAAKTMFLDCDGWGDGVIKLQIRDTNPVKDYITAQEWFIRAIGKPEENFAFFTKAGQYSCVLLEDPDGIPNSGDEDVACSLDGESTWIPLGYVSTAGYDSNGDGEVTPDEACVKQVKLRGKNSSKGGGKTPFCNITPEFEVDVDLNGDDITDMFDQFIFSISCLDDLATTEIDESLYCPLSSIIWDVDTSEPDPDAGTGTTLKAKAQIFVSHSGDNIRIKKGKIKRRDEP